MKRTKRTRNFELTLQISDDAFLATPRDSQRNWLLNRLMKETADELEHLNIASKSFVAGRDAASGLHDPSRQDLADDEIMEDWQIPVMESMADLVTASHGDVLEIGFGRGVASSFIQQRGVASHTIIECKESIVARFERWKTRYADQVIRMVPGMWQDVIGDLGEFDGIFFHTNPLSESDFVEQVVKRSTFAEHFFPVAAQHLRRRGVFTYLTNESDSLSRAHQRALLEHFSSFSASLLRDLAIPQETRDATWSNSIVIVEAKK